MNKTDIRDLILEELIRQERNLNWLHRKTNIPYPTLYSTFIQKIIKLSDDKLQLINGILGTKFSL